MEQQTVTDRTDGPRIISYEPTITDAYADALAAWASGKQQFRQKNRPDGIPTRCDIQWMTPAELSITKAIASVEDAGAGAALTDAVTLLSKARDRVADHVEGVTEP